MVEPDGFMIEARVAQPVLEIDAEAHYWKIPSEMARGFSQIGKHIEASGGERVSMPYARYLELDWQSLRGNGFQQLLDFLWKKQKMRFGLPVATPIEGMGDISATEIAAGKYLTTMHRGPYRKVGNTYRKLVDWAEEQGLRLSDNSIESYIDDPTDMPIEHVRTQIYVAILA
jgi:effector-binding domain-containing protein